MTTRVGMLLYPGLTQLDLTGPFEVLHRVPNAWRTGRSSNFCAIKGGARSS